MSRASAYRCGLLAVLLWSACTPAPAHPSADCDEGALAQTLSSQPSAAVIIVLRDQAAQDDVLRELGAEFEVGRRYQSTPALAGTLTRAGYEHARTLGAVRCVQLDGTGSGAENRRAVSEVATAYFQQWTRTN